MLNYSLDLVFAALADATRRGMLERLTRRPWSVSELAEPLDMSLPAVLQHLAVLETAGLVTTEKLGRVRTVTLAPGAVRAAETWLQKRHTQAERQLDRLAAVLEEKPQEKKP